VFAAALLCLAAAVPGAAAGRPTAGSPAAEAAGWARLEPGLDLGAFRSSLPPIAGDGTIQALRIDPRRFTLRLLNASAPGQGGRLTAREWCRRERLVAAINAGMYQQDMLTAVSLMRTRTHVNNPRLTKDRAILAFDPLDDALPRVQIIDRDCQDFTALARRYGSLVQGIRMVSCTRENVWARQPRAASAAAIGMDGEGRVLFLHARSHWSVHDLIAALLALPLDLRSAMYAEGGSEAQLYVAEGHGLEFLGSHAPDAPQIGDEPAAEPIPNVIGVVRSRP
jgi:hypothetical protein